MSAFSKKQRCAGAPAKAPTPAPAKAPATAPAPGPAGALAGAPAPTGAALATGGGGQNAQGFAPDELLQEHVTHRTGLHGVSKSGSWACLEHVSDMDLLQWTCSVAVSEAI